MALLLRLAAAAAINVIAADRFLFGDSDSYWVLAENLARGKAYRYGANPEQGRILRVPGYPLVLAAMLRPCLAVWPAAQQEVTLASPHSRLHLRTVRIAQTLIGTLAVYLVYLLGLHAWDRRVGLVAAGMAAIYPVFVVFTPLVLSETLFSVIVLAQLLVCVILVRRPVTQGRSTHVRYIRLAAAAGLLWALATLVRASWIAFGVLFIPWHLYAAPAEEPARRVRLGHAGALLAIVGAFAATMTPWWIRNAAVTGRFVPTTLWVGASLYDGLNPSATGASNMDFIDRLKPQGLTEYEQDRFLRDQAMRFAQSQPLRVVELAGIKFVRFWNIWPNAPQFRTWPRRIVVAAAFVPVLLLGLRGAWTQRDHRRVVVLLAAPVIYLCLMHMIFVGSIRYRLPGMYPWMVLAAAGMVTCRGRDHDQQRTRDVYGLLWTRLGPIRQQQDEETFRTKTGLGAEQLRGRRVLDAGCGNGRYLRVAVGAGAEAIGMDISDAVFRARDVVAGQSHNAQFVQGDLLRPPLAEGQFDVIYAIGVLEHTPDPQRAFANLAVLLRPGGQIAVWLHPKWRPALERIDRLQRAVSSRLPLGLLVTLSRMAVPLGGAKRRLLAGGKPARLLGLLLHAASLGVSLHPDPATRWCDTFNWYAPRWRSHHTAEEVRMWFQEAGLEEIRDLSPAGTHYYAGQGEGVNFTARKPRV